MSYQEMYDQALHKNQLENMTPKFIDFKESGTKIVGCYVTKNGVISEDNEHAYNQYIFDTDDGLVKFHLGSATDREAGNMFKEGEVYYIEFLGKEKISPTRKVNKFRIERLVLDTSD